MGCLQVNGVIRNIKKPMILMNRKCRSFLLEEAGVDMVYVSYEDAFKRLDRWRMWIPTSI